MENGTNDVHLVKNEEVRKRPPPGSLVPDEQTTYLLKIHTELRNELLRYISTESAESLPRFSCVPEAIEILTRSPGLSAYVADGVIRSSMKGTAEAFTELIDLLILGNRFREAADISEYYLGFRGNGDIYGRLVCAYVALNGPAGAREAIGRLFRSRQQSTPEALLTELLSHFPSAYFYYMVCQLYIGCAIEEADMDKKACFIDHGKGFAVQLQRQYPHSEYGYLAEAKLYLVGGNNESAQNCLQRLILTGRPPAFAKHHLDRRERLIMPRCRLLYIEAFLSTSYTVASVSEIAMIAGDGLDEAWPLTAATRSRLERNELGTTLRTLGSIRETARAYAHPMPEDRTVAPWDMDTSHMESNITDIL